MTTLARTRTPEPLTRLGRRRAGASVGGLAVLTGSTATGRRPAPTPSWSASSGTGTSTGLTGPTAHLGAVARTGGQR